MTSLRLAFVLTALMGCARGALDEDPPVQNPPVDGEMDAGDVSLDPTPDAATRRDASTPRDGGPIVTFDAATADGGRTPDAGGASDAGQAATGMLTSKTVDVGGTQRSYSLYVPMGLDASTAAPLVSVHHPYGQNNQYMVSITTWRQVADREKFVIVFPDGGSLNPWNVGTGVCGWGSIASAAATQDDIGFVRAMATEVAKVQAVQPKVFVAGLNMGGYFANHIGCAGRDVVRAIASHSSGTYAGDCAGTPVPALVIHGDADDLISPQCGQAALSYWVTRNGCNSTTTSEAIKGGECLWNQGCPSGRDVGICVLNGMRHGWAGAPDTGLGGWLMFKYGGGEQFEDGAELIWKFFKKFL